MLDELRGAPLLARGPRPTAASTGRRSRAMLVALGRLGMERPDILEVDLNPVIAAPSGAIAVDALVVLEGGGVMAEPTEPVVLTEPTPWGVRLTLNRPAKLNAISAELRDALTAAIAAAVADDAVRVIVIAGAGRAFCSGYDLAEAQPDVAWGWRGVLGEDVDATLAIWRSPSRSSRRSTATRWPAGSSSRWPAT